MTNNRTADRSDSVLAVIVARGGSKGLPRKNLAMLGDHSLVAHAAIAAHASGAIDRVVISTDDHEIAESAQRAGAEVPFIRPAELALDSTPGIMPIRHAVEHFENIQQFYKWIVLLQPTSPLRSGADIAGALALARAKRADKVIGVTAVHQQPHWMFAMDADGSLERFLPPSEAADRRQTLPALFAANGAVYVYSRDAVFAQDTSGQRVFGFQMPPERSIDIDSAWDLTVARLIYAHLQQLTR
jgi:CMP-N-acetylneuraminic acid synthetase